MSSPSLKCHATIKALAVVNNLTFVVKIFNMVRLTAATEVQY